MKDPRYDFVKDAGRIINSGQSRSLVLTGNITDLFYSHGDDEGAYVPLVELLVDKWSIKGSLLVVYELNGPTITLRNPKKPSRALTLII